MRKFLLTIAALGGAALAAPLFAEEGDAFSQIDKNKDGFITADEVEENKKALFERLLRVVDDNADKKLSKEEFTKGTQKSAETKPPLAGEAGRGGTGGFPNPKEILARLDKNGDGKISKEEAPDRMKENFDRLDANKDGFIEADEFAKAAAAFGGRPGGGAPPAGAPAGIDAKGAEEIFDKQDANSDGKLTRDEVPDERRENFQRMLDRLNSTDGALTKEQFVRAMLANQRRPDGAGDPPPGGRPGFPGGMPPLPIVRALDTDGDGEISKEEIAAASKALAALDNNGDGKLSRDEFLPNFPGGFPGRPGDGRPPGRPGQPGAEGRPGLGARFSLEEMLRRLKDADKNGDGKISKEEAPDRMKENFDRIDTNGDGQLDEAEIKTMLERMQQGFGGRRPEGRPERKPQEKKE